MLSPALASPPPNLPSSNGNTGAVTNTGPTTRRRGLSYLRSLSSRDTPVASSAGTADANRTSPRHFFSRSSSYQDTKISRDVEGRRRSRSYTRPADVPALSATPLVRVASEQGGAPTPSETAPRQQTPPTSADSDEMTRHRSNMIDAQTSEESQTGGATATSTMTRSISNGAVATTDTVAGLPTIRFYPHQEMTRAGRQSLNFSPVSRTLPSEDSVIKVGRYSEREGPPIANPSGPSDAPVGFKSKVVSRRHCEFSFVDGQWNIRDVASSSGTFLNHIRLSQPNTASNLYPIKDGDIVQLGIDFRGGEEMIFRCVKIRIECNRSWQKKPNNFNKQRQAQLRGLAKDQPSANANSQECSICLGNVHPCQALFVAPCAHVWHYKCIRPMLEGRNSQYPQFQCPNCRLYTDLEADVDIDPEDWAEDSADAAQDAPVDQSDDQPQTAAAPAAENEINDDTHSSPESQLTASQALTNASNAQPSQQNQPATPLHTRRQNQHSSPEPSNQTSPANGIVLPARPSEAEIRDSMGAQTRVPDDGADHLMSGMGNEGPLTPRNNAGPFVFDGSGGRRQLNMPIRNLDELSDDIE